MIWLLKQKALPSAARPNLAYKRLHINKAPEDLEKCRNIASVWYQATLSGCNFWISKCKTTISIRVKMLVNFFGRNSKKKNNSRIWKAIYNTTLIRIFCRSSKFCTYVSDLGNPNRCYKVYITLHQAVPYVWIEIQPYTDLKNCKSFRSDLKTKYCGHFITQELFYHSKQGDSLFKL